MERNATEAQHTAGRAVRWGGEQGAGEQARQVGGIMQGKLALSVNESASCQPRSTR